MKVLFVSSGNNRLGVTSIIRTQGESLIRAGVDLEYFLVKGKGVIGYLGAVLKLRRWLKAHAVDIIHAHYGLCGWVAYWAKQRGTSIIVSYMGSDILPVLKVKKAPHSFCVRFSQALQYRVDHVIVKSLNMKDVLTRENEVSIIPNGVDIARFTPMPKKECRKRLGWSEDKKIVLFMGNPSDEIKNIILVKKAICLIENPDIILSNPYPVGPELVPLYLNMADLLVLPSISEGSPNLVKEAMACNCPIVATDVGDIKWVMGDTEGCYLTSYSPEDVARKIELALRFKARTNGRNRILDLKLDSYSVARKVIETYEAVLMKRSQ